MTTESPMDKMLQDNDAEEIKMDKQTEKYFATIRHNIEQLYSIAETARMLGLDPEEKVECPQTHDVADRVEELIGPVGIADRIRELHKQKLDPDQIAFKIADEIIDGNIGNFNFSEKVDRAIRVAMAIKTQGVVSAPLEGINKIVIRENPFGPKYLSLYFSGPIRNAGGTIQAFAVLVADYVREKMGIEPFQATQKEIDRMIEEVKLYDRKVNLQYPSTKEELEHALKNLKVELNGDPTERFEVSAHRDMRRIETNVVRSGPVLVLNDGVLLKSKKLGKMISHMDIAGWDWLSKIKGGKKEQKVKDETDAILTPVEKRRKRLEEKVSPSEKYLSGVIAGRPVISHPSRIGGFRVRYGRSRNTGLAACGINPNTMYACNEFLAIGTQIKIERPGKAASVMPVSSIEGPVCLLKNGDVVQFNEPKSLQVVTKDNPVISILFLGDILFGYGEFSENNHVVFPSSYVEEWWVLELEKAINSGKSNGTNSNSIQDLENWIDNPFTSKPSGSESIELSKLYNIPIHPAYTSHFGNVNGYDLLHFRQEIKDYYYQQKQQFDTLKNLRIPANELCKNVLYQSFTPHKNHSEYFELDNDLSAVFIEILGLSKEFSPENLQKLENSDKTALEVLPSLSDLIVRDKGTYYMGARMGRPEKAKFKKLKHNIQVLFPLGHGAGRNIEKASRSKRYSSIDIVNRQCPRCGEITYRNKCNKCNEHTIIRKMCKTCSTYVDKTSSSCPTCGGRLTDYSKQKINLNQIYAEIPPSMDKIISHNVNCVEGLTSQFKVAEPIEKGILRARNEVFVYNDGTIRFDAIDIPLTHFTPFEIKTSVEKLNEMGYTHDYKGNILTEGTQICELKCQDFVAPTHAGDYFVKVAHFIDDELEYIYSMERFYNCTNREDLIGHYFAGLSPHTSASIVGRLIGYAPIHALYAHPYWHAAKRRNCFPEDSKVLVEIDNQITRIPIKSLYDDFFKQEIEIENGFMKSVKKRDVQVFSFDKSQNKVFKTEIKNVIKVPSTETLIKFKLITGREFSTTPDHPVLVVSNNEVIEKKALEVEKGDKFILPHLNFPEEDKNKLDLLIVFSEQSFRSIHDDLMLRNINNFISELVSIKGLKCTAEILNINKKTLNNYYCSRDSVPLALVLKLLDIHKKKITDIPNCTLGFKRDHTEVPRVISYNSELMRLFGYYIAEGYFRETGRGYQVEFAVSEDDIRADILHCIIKVFGKGFKPHVNENHIVIGNHVIYLIFKEIWGFANSSRMKRIPPFVYKLPPDKKRNLLKAYFTGDGGLDKSHGVVSCSTFSSELANDLDTLLLSLGIFSAISKYEKEGYGFEYKVRIRGENVKKYKLQIGFTSNRKSLLLDQIVKNKKTRPEKKLGRNRLLRIRDIEIVKSPSNFVYSLEAEKYHTILINENIVTHQCDGDEDGIMLMLDLLLNFSKYYLSSKIGGKMDAPLMLTVTLIPAEVDSEAWNVDCASKYSLDFYEFGKKYMKPGDIEKGDHLQMDIVQNRIGKINQYSHIDFTHPTENITYGPKLSTYKVLNTTEEKIHSQLNLHDKIIAVDAQNVVKKMLQTHFTPDIMGNLRTFSQQEVRCRKNSCGEKYRRVPLSGRCRKCGGELQLTVTQGGIEKYLKRSLDLSEEYDLGLYTIQRMKLMDEYVKSLTDNPKIKQVKITSFFK